MSSSPSGALRPLELGAGIEAKNRMFFSSMGLDLCDTEGFPKPAFFELYEALIEGGCGFGFLCNATVDPATRFNARGLKLTTENHVEALAPLLAFAVSRGVPLGVQLQHYGPQAAGAGLATPSPEMSEAGIATCIEQFVAAARLAQRAGAPMVQLQAANGYLLSSFLSPRSNQRTDRWGGSPRKRARILTTIVERIHADTGGRLPVSVRLGMDDGLGAAGQRPELLTQVVRDLQDVGVLSIECSVGVRETFRQFFTNATETRDAMRRGCRYLKQEVDIPVGFTGSVTSVAQADEIICAGDADFVGFARAVLADNHLVAKEMAGDSGGVHRCRGDAYCFRDKKEPAAERVYCCVNPAYPRPQELQNLYEGDSQ